MSGAIFCSDIVHATGRPKIATFQHSLPFCITTLLHELSVKHLANIFAMFVYDRLWFVHIKLTLNYVRVRICFGVYSGICEFIRHASAPVRYDTVQHQQQSLFAMNKI